MSYIEEKEKEMESIVNTIVEKMIELVKLTLTIKYSESSYVPNSGEDLLEYARNQPLESIFWGTSYSEFYAVVEEYVIYGDYCGWRTDTLLEKTMKNEDMWYVLRRIMDIIGTPALP